MIEETSAGIVLFRKEESKILFLLLHYPSGHWDFVKGKMEQEESTHQTAVRETKEEIGIDSSSLKSLGQLSSLYTPVSYFNIHVFLWYSKIQPQIKINDSEVDQVYKISLDELIDNNLVLNTPINKSGFKINVPAYHFNEWICWGATAMIITELKDIINES